jgi:hypothetical protein
VLRRAAFFAAGVATAVLFVLSRGKWSDALIDSGREWMVPDALSRGDVLYRDVVYWFGPFTPYAHSVFFRLLGSNFRSLAIAGAFGAAAVLACLHLALRRVTQPRAAWAWTALAIPALVFMPEAGGAILGMGHRIWHAAGFSLLSLAILARSGVSKKDALTAGCVAGLAGLCRVEWGLAAAAALGVLAFERFGVSKELRSALARMAAGFVGVQAVVFGIFAAFAGPAAFVRDAPVLLFNLPAETASSGAKLTAGGLWRGCLQMLYGAVACAALFLALELFVASRRDRQEVPTLLRRLGLALVVLAVCGAAAGLPGNPFFAGAPLLCAVAAVVGVRTARQPLGAALAAFGVLGVLASHRRFFFLTDAPYVGPPLLFAIVCAAGLTALATDRLRTPLRDGLASLVPAAVALLTAAAFAGRSLDYLSDDRLPIPGTHGMLSAAPGVRAEILRVAETLRRETPAGSGAVVFPEGELVNYLSGRPNPIRHKLYLPGYVTARNEPVILDELDRARPAALVIWPRPVGEYGRGFFGRDYAVSLRRWIDAHYRQEPNIGRQRPQVFFRKPEPLAREDPERTRRP